MAQASQVPQVKPKADPSSMVIDLHREIARLKLLLSEKDKQLEAVSRERNHYKAKYTDLKGKIHQ